MERTGIRTTEFWITLIVALAGLLPASGLLPENHWGVKVCGLVVSLVAAMNYTVSRGSVKKATTTAAKVLVVALLIGLLAGCGGQGYLMAGNIWPAVEVVTYGYDDMLQGLCPVCRGTGIAKGKTCTTCKGAKVFDPKNIAAEDLATYLRTSEMLRSTVQEVAAKK
jgi:hypothetical protein